MPAVLTVELEYYEANKDDILNHHKGSFVLIRGREFIGAYTTEAEAYDAGVERFGDEAFLIRHAIEGAETAYFPALTLSVLHADPQ